MQDLTGKQIGRYKILKSIGEGGMATVYLAEDVNLERQVAVKVIRAERVTPEQLPRIMERFKREAKALAKLSDEPGIVTVYDYGEYEGTPYLVMAYMPGGTLKERLGQPMEYREAARLLLPVAEALSEAHQHGIIHRDVKPSNLLVTRKDSLALADFGIAKALEVDGQTLTGTGMGVGTPEYMAPEQWKGEASQQTDIYALGVVLYEMVTGQKPYSAGTPSEVFLKQMTEVPVPPRELVPGLPQTVEIMLTQAMHKEAGNRFVDMKEFFVALQGLVSGVPLHDDFPTAVPQPDPEATYDELAIPVEGVAQLEVVEPPVRQVEPPRAVSVTPAREKKGAKRGWLLAGGIGVFGLLGIAAVIGLVSLFKNTRESVLTPIAIEESAIVEAATDEKPTSMPELGIGSTMVSAIDGMEMVYIPAGTFTMGSEDGSSDEQPIHEVYLDAYWMDKYEVTNEQYKQCVADSECDEPRDTDYYDDSSYADHPVVYVSWYNAQDYCEWAGRRLPSEAEWEKAARGTDGRTYPWGDEFDSSYANVDDETLYDDYTVTCNEKGCDGYDRTSPVGSFPEGVSLYGVMDMAGNVWEWTSSLYEGYPYDADDGREDLNVSGGRVLRGGSWDNIDGLVRAANRVRINPSGTLSSGGFRCASSPK